MKKRVWIFNHYATDMFFTRGGRHYWFAKYLIRNGYEPTIFCASTRHNTKNQLLTIKRKKWKTDKIDGITFVFVKTTNYLRNGLDRVKNMYSFYRNIFLAAKEYTEFSGSPDVILASSVHPLTLVAGIKIAKKIGIQCICEVRDLWPESIVAYGKLRSRSVLAKLLYFGEKWIYAKADKLIFTMEGARDYIIDKGWDQRHGGPVSMHKVYHINNGVDLEAFDNNLELFKLEDEDLNNNRTFKAVYAGSIGRSNDLDTLLDVAKLIGEEDVLFLVWGDGDYLENLKHRVVREKISNVLFKGRVDKKYIPYILSKANLNLLISGNVPLLKYGASFNKMFDYMASGKPILSNVKPAYSVLDKYRAGLEVTDNSCRAIAQGLAYFRDMDWSDYDEYCRGARRAAEDYCFANLTMSLIEVIEE